MPDCARCNRPLGAGARRCSSCGACEECCECDELDWKPFTPAELGLDPEDYDVEVWENAPRRRRGQRGGGYHA